MEGWRGAVFRRGCAPEAKKSIHIAGGHLFLAEKQVGQLKRDTILVGKPIIRRAGVLGGRWGIAEGEWRTIRITRLASTGIKWRCNAITGKGLTVYYRVICDVLFVLFANW